MAITLPLTGVPANKATLILDAIRPGAEKVGIFPSVKAAQMILESGWLTSTLTTNAFNCFGMKEILSGNTWPNSTWDGKSVYTTTTGEQKTDGTKYTIVAKFRKYNSIEDSAADHSAYLLGAKNGAYLRYAGITECKNYREQIQLIKDGGYATDVSYVDKVCLLIQQYNLDRYDSVKISDEVLVPMNDNNVPDDWAKDMWEYATKMGFTDGTRPRDPITRQETMGMIIKALGALKIDGMTFKF